MKRYSVARIHVKSTVGTVMSYRILSMDGGGAWALIEVRALMAIFGESTKGHDVLAHFDMVAANSGGSLVLGGLIEDLTLKDLLGYFEDKSKREAIFSPTKSAFLRKPLQWLAGVGPKYSSRAKLPAIRRIMPKTSGLTLADAAVGIRRQGSQQDILLFIVGYDYDRRRAKFFRSIGSDGLSGYGRQSGVTMAEAIHASTNAPVNYFDAPAVFSQIKSRYWDGAISGCNNPVLVAVTEAIVRGHRPEDIIALSLGTGSLALPWPQPGEERSPYVQTQDKHSIQADIPKLAKAILAEPVDIANFMAHVMTGCGAGLPDGGSRIVRMNPLISPVRVAGGKWMPPEGLTEKTFVYLKNLDMDAVEQKRSWRSAILPASGSTTR